LTGINLDKHNKGEVIDTIDYLPFVMSNIAEAQTAENVAERGID
jgi:hypothetical protein